MSKSVRILLATVAGITAGVLAYYLFETVLMVFLQWLAGDPAMFQELYRGFDGNPFFILVMAAIAIYGAVIGYRLGWKYLGKFGIPGVVAPYSESIGEQPIAVRVFVNGQDELGQVARLEVFSHKVSAATLQEFYWSENPKPLVIRAEGGLYLQLIKTGKSPYEADNASNEPTIAVKVRTRKRILHSLESVWGVQPTYVVQEGKPIAFFRLALDYVGSQTDAHGMLVCNGSRGLMESVFLKQPKVAAPKPATQSVQGAQSGEAHEDHQGGHQARPGETAPQPAN